MRHLFTRRVTVSLVAVIMLVAGLGAAPVAAQNPITAAREAIRKAQEEFKRQQEEAQRKKNGPAAAQPAAAPPATGQNAPPAVGSAAAAKVAASTAKIEEQILAPLQEGASFYVSPRGVHVATVGLSGSRQVVTYDGVEGPKFDAIVNREAGAGSQHGINFSPDGTRYAYVARLGQEYVYMVDGKELVRLPMATTNIQLSTQDHHLPRFTSNSKHTYFVSLSTDNQTRVFFDGRPGLPGGYGPVISPDGERFAYVAANPANQAQRTLIVDGKPAGYLGGDPQFSADSKHLFTQRVASATQTTEVLLDGKPFLRGRLLTLYIPPVGDLVVAVDEPGPDDRSGPPFLVVGGKKVEGTDGCPVVSTNRVIFSPDGRHYAAHCQRSPTINWVVVDGKKSLEYQGIAKLSFTPDSTKVVYQAGSGGRNFIVVGEQESDGFALLVNPVIAPAGNRVGGLTTSPGATLIMDGKTTKLNARLVSDLAFSPDGQHYAYIAQDGTGEHLVLDGVVQTASLYAPVGGPSAVFNTTYVGFGSFVNSRFGFSRDGTHVAHIAAPPKPTGNFERGLFLDGRYIPLGISGSYSNFTFTPDGRHLLWIGTPAPDKDLRVFADGKLVYEGDSAGNPITMPGWWEMGADGTLSFLAQDDTSLKRIRITLANDTNIDTFLATARK